MAAWLLTFVDVVGRLHAVPFVTLLLGKLGGKPMTNRCRTQRTLRNVLIASIAGILMSEPLWLNSFSRAADQTGRGGPGTPPSAPAGFDNVSNGFDKDPNINGDFDKDRAKFEEVEDINNNGLGPVYNDRSCANCHQNPVSGSSGQTSELRAGFKVRALDVAIHHFDFVEPDGGSLIHQRAIDARIQEHVPTTLPAVGQPEERSAIPVQTLRMTTNLLGNGFVEMIPDDDILDYEQQQPASMRGLAICVPVPIRPDPNSPGKFIFGARIGRFGWKCQEASLLNFAAGAYINEMGITNPLNLKEDLSNGRDVSGPEFDPATTPEPEDKPSQDHPFGEDVEAFTRFIRATKVPPELERGPPVPSDPTLPPGDIERGRRIFGLNELTNDGRVAIRSDSESIGCVICHRADFVTPDPGTKILSLAYKTGQPTVADGSDLPGSTVPNSLGRKLIHPYSDFMLHDIGTGDGIVQTQFAQDPSAGAEIANTVTADALTRFATKRKGTFDYKMVRIERGPVGLRNPQAPAGADSVPRRLQEKTMTGQDAPLDQRTRNKVRTAPLWGLRVRIQLLHDGSALTVDEAIRRHRNEAAEIEERYEALSPGEQNDLLAFLNSLGFGARNPGSSARGAK